MARLTSHTWHQQLFDNTTTPPAPVLSLQIAGPEADDWIDISTALVDTGADATIIPDALLSQILAAEWDQARLRSQWGEFRLVYRFIECQSEKQTEQPCFGVARAALYEGR